MTQILENTALKGDCGKWGKTKGRKFHIAITRDEDGAYSVVALNLPGVGSCGATPEQALKNFKEAAQGTVESYEEAGEEIPWKNVANDDIPFGAERKWIIVDV
jgi:predicted RNase H-like HicB family nuclease